MPTHTRRGAGAALAVVLALCAATPALATVVLRLPLARIASEAARIVHGTVVDVRSGRDDVGLPATWITLDVARTVKGPAARRLTVKQFGVAEPLPDGTAGHIAGLPRYAVGDEVVLFLRAESRRGLHEPGRPRAGRRTASPARRASAEVRRDEPRGTSRDLDDFLGRGRAAGRRRRRCEPAASSLLALGLVPRRRRAARARRRPAPRERRRRAARLERRADPVQPGPRPARLAHQRCGRCQRGRQLRRLGRGADRQRGVRERGRAARRRHGRELRELHRRLRRRARPDRLRHRRRRSPTTCSASGRSDSILGFAGPECGTYVPPVITEGSAVLNGKCIDGIASPSNPEISLADFNGVFVHEFGHYHEPRPLAGEPARGRGRRPDERRRGRHDVPVPRERRRRAARWHLDDTVSVSMLYPSPSFASGFGRLTGRVLRSDGMTPFQGAYVIARRLGDPRTTAVGMASGARYFPSVAGGPPSPSLQGFFELPGLPAGSYTVEVEGDRPGVHRRLVGRAARPARGPSRPRGVLERRRGGVRPTRPTIRSSPRR